jgi:hypothetical protein
MFHDPDFNKWANDFQDTQLIDNQTKLTFKVCHFVPGVPFCFMLSWHTCYLNNVL